MSNYMILTDSTSDHSLWRVLPSSGMSSERVLPMVQTRKMIENIFIAMITAVLGVGAAYILHILGKGNK